MQNNENYFLPVSVHTQTGVALTNKSTSTYSVSTSYAETQTDLRYNAEIESSNESITSIFPNFDNFVAKLKLSGQLDKFVHLVNAIATGQLPTNNLSWKCALDMGFLSQCTSTTRMRYDPDCVEFFSLFKLMFGSSAINVLCGTAHFGSIVEDTSEKGRFNPASGNFNFPIPSLNTLRTISTGYPTDVKVGIVEHSLDITQEEARNGAQYVLGLDGKMVAQGCKNDSDGDVNLWGAEQPSLTSAVRNLNLRKQCAEAIDFKSSDSTVPEHNLKFRRLSLHISRTLRQLRSRITTSFRQRQRLVSLAQENPDNVPRYTTRLSFLHQNSAECDSVLRNGLDAQQQVMEALCILNKRNIPSNHIVLSEVPNVFQLLQPDKIRNILNLNDEMNAEYIKQRSVEWKSLRQTARVTGSTFNAALGLDTLAKQKEHHYTFICGRSAHEPNEELAKKFRHGTENEVNVVATLVGYIMPAFLHNCYAFFEVGAKILKSTKNDWRLIVSADGLLKCPDGEQCLNFKEHGDRVIVVEIKSPYSSVENPHITTYDIPTRYVPQILLEIEAWKATEAWLLVGTPQSVTTFRCFPSTDLLSSFMGVADDLYGEIKPSVPTKLHTQVPALKENIKAYIKTNTSFFLECPSLTGEEGNLQQDMSIASAYAVAPNLVLEDIDHTDVDFKVAVVNSESKRFFDGGHTVLRNQASEVIVFMATNKDRKQSEGVPYSLPVAYGLKGSSMTNEDLRHMLNLLRLEFRKRSIPIICEVFDGQWHNHITHDASGRSLTKLGWRHKWQEISNFSKQKCIEKLVNCCRVKPANIQILSGTNALRNGGEVSTGNIKVECEIKVPTMHQPSRRIIRKILTAQTNGGDEFSFPVMREIITVCKHSRPDLFPDEIGFATCHRYADNPGTMPPETILEPVDNTQQTVGVDNVDHSYAAQGDDVPVKKKKTRKRIVGMLENEKNILHLLHRETVMQICEEIDDMEEDPTSGDLLYHVLLNPLCTLLIDIVKQLQYFDASKWGCTSVEDIFPHLLTDGEYLSKTCTLKELNIICKTLEHHTDRAWYPQGAVKSTHVNNIVKAFGGNSLVEEIQRRQRKTSNPETLKSISKKILLGTEYDVKHLQIVVGTLLVRRHKADWFRRSTIEPSVYVPIAAGPSRPDGEVIELFSYPEVTTDEALPIFRTFDYTHILTNMRAHILTRGYDFCRKEDFLWMVDNTTGILSRYMVEYKMDAQNAFSAMKMFGMDVSQCLEENGFTESAKFVNLVRQWHNACDERGLSADLRVSQLVAMFKFLTKDINFWSVPFQYSGRYIRGMTWQTFEAILQMISTRIQMYDYCTNGSYNARAVSTLANESFFADLVRLDKDGKGYPKACNVGKVIGRVVMLNYFKHKRNKNYVLTATLKPKYPPQLAEDERQRLETETAEDHHGIYRDNVFDLTDAHKSQRCRRSDITTGINPQRGVVGVRTYYKVDESKILPELRAGNKPKGFSLE